LTSVIVGYPLPNAFLVKEMDTGQDFGYVVNFELKIAYLAFNSTIIWALDCHCFPFLEFFIRQG